MSQKDFYTSSTKCKLNLISFIFHSSGFMKFSCQICLFSEANIKGIYMHFNNVSFLTNYKSSL